MQQRVAIARALTFAPALLLMDEPFGAIDPVTRARLQDEFLGLQAEVRKTVVFVTHDIEEAVKMGDRIAILNVGGVLAQYDVPAEILGHPASPMVADFVGPDRGLKRLRGWGRRWSSAMARAMGGWARRRGRLACPGRRRPPDAR